MKKYKHVIGLCLGVILLCICLGIGFSTDMFDSFEDMAEGMTADGTTFLKAAVAIFILVIVSNFFQLFVNLLKKGHGRALTMASVISSLIKYAIVIFGICWVLTIFGVNVNTIFASIGVMALIVGFGAERMVADVVTGVFFLFENNFNVGDIIEVDGFRGTVDTIGIRTISLRDTGGNIKIINNSDLANIINRSAQGSVALAEVGVAYSTDLDELEEKIGDILAKIREKRSDIFIGEINYLGVEALADSAVVLKFKADVAEKDIFAGRRVLNKELKCAFDREGIEIAFPQIDVHMKQK